MIVSFRKTSLSLAVSTLALILAACSGGSGGSGGGPAGKGPNGPMGGNNSQAATGAKGGCGYVNGTMCLDYERVSWTQEDLRRVCAGISESTFFPEGCPATNRVGRCRALGEEISVTHYYAPATADSVQQGCTLAGHEFLAD